ncbi:hypothetical protein JOF53_000170 [Crossiella equi]|uniref:DUF4180 domain-containing protein n=1 Tax=Crossiella equi TaxID=130796 RepID=A0ABS5A439_9PSEU|nr:DUF4180 domain-containing protein [Crossiella equi]MBP2471298.1 hypothetical protein [Crossiella equi]
MTIVHAGPGPVLTDERAALDLMADHGFPTWLLVPVERLPEEFFKLRTGVAGAVVQKFVNYNVKLAVVGDLSARIAASPTLADFVREANRWRQLWFVASEAAFHTKLAGPGQPPATRSPNLATG